MRWARWCAAVTIASLVGGAQWAGAQGSGGTGERGERAASPHTVVTNDMLLQAASGGDWLMYGHNYWNNRFSPLNKLNTANVKNLVPRMVFTHGAERLGSFCPPSAARTPPALRQDPRRVPAWRALFRRNAAGQAPVRAPVLIVQGGAEGAAPLQVVARIDGRLCGLGGRSALRLYPGVHHGQVVDASGQDVLAWLDARLAGRPAAPCGPATTAPPAPPPSGVTAHLAG